MDSLGPQTTGGAWAKMPVMASRCLDVARSSRRLHQPVVMGGRLNCLDREGQVVIGINVQLISLVV